MFCSFTVWLVLNFSFLCTQQFVSLHSFWDRKWRTTEMKFKTWILPDSTCSSDVTERRHTWASGWDVTADGRTTSSHEFSQQIQQNIYLCFTAVLLLLVCVFRCLFLRLVQTEAPAAAITPPLRSFMCSVLHHITESTAAWSHIRSKVKTEAAVTSETQSYFK